MAVGAPVGTDELLRKSRDKNRERRYIGGAGPPFGTNSGKKQSAMLIVNVVLETKAVGDAYRKGGGAEYEARRAGSRCSFLGCKKGSNKDAQ